jgi:tRNA nucleotidyltransferase (CCA-adding enzyme)
MRMYRVGGCVRDGLLGRKPKDIDYVVTLLPTEVQTQHRGPFALMVENLKCLGYQVFVESPEFFTARARDPRSRETHDYVLARREGPSSDGRHPDWVEPGELIDDLQRRDFTINAMAQNDDGEIIDPFFGKVDLFDGIIRTVGDPTTRFQEDRLRLLRALRFSMTLGFRIDSATSNAMRLLINNEDEPLGAVSEERIREELTKMFEVDSVNAFRLLDDYNLARSCLRGRVWLKPTMKERG